MSRSASDKRPASGNSRNAWNDDGLDAPGGRPDSISSGEFENRDLRLGDDGDMMPTAMEGEAYVDGEIVVAGQESKKQSKPKPVSGCMKLKNGLRCELHYQLLDYQIDYIISLNNWCSVDICEYCCDAFYSMNELHRKTQDLKTHRLTDSETFQ